MHQPQYKDALTGQYALPWTYLHAVKDYTDMAAHLEGNPAARAVVNFTPLLIEQIEELARRVAEHLHNASPLPDPVLALLGPDPVPTEPAARLELLRTCLRAQRQQMIERFGPYLELATIAETLGTPERVAYASDQFIHDLAVWYHLAWLGESVRRTDPLVARLTERGRDFSPTQRRDLLTLIGSLVGQVLSRYRRLAERGQCELSVTPYGHPIIPLLLDFQCARDALPTLQLPAHAAYPGGVARATWHIEEAIRVFTRVFGARPAGCWPAEGAVSAATLALLAGTGFRWAASSDGVLRGSLTLTDANAALDPLAYNRPYRLGGTGMSWFFRDDTLSDLIGFTYATWMGDADKNRAWDLLCNAKEAYDRVMQDAGDPGERAAAGRQLARCESSDWFWWFGDYNPADAVSQFDHLYRRQLLTLYRQLNLPPPGELTLPISTGHGAPEHGGSMRRATGG